jgi:hypothetical protein
MMNITILREARLMGERHADRTTDLSDMGVVSLLQLNNVPRYQQLMAVDAYREGVVIGRNKLSANPLCDSP